MVRNVSLLLFIIKIALLLKNSVNGQDCFRELELAIEIRSALTTLNERLDTLETDFKKELNELKREMIGEIEKRSLSQNENLKNELIKIKREIITETPNMLPRSDLTDIKNELTKLSDEIVNKNSVDENAFSKYLKKDNDTVTIELHVCKSLPADCKEVQNSGYNESGIYRIHPKLAKNSFLVWCDMKTEQGGWTYLINRFDGSQNFNMNWTDYKKGFGNLSGEHWLGLEHMYELTNSKSNELLVELVDWESKTVHEFYANFQIGNESEGYILKGLGEFGGDAGDSLSEHADAKFSTLDKDHYPDNGRTATCPSYFKAGWWFKSCARSILTGVYVNIPQHNKKYEVKSGIKWGEFHGYNYSLKEARMMIRPTE